MFCYKSKVFVPQMLAFLKQGKMEILYRGCSFLIENESEMSNPKRRQRSVLE